jgi:hypothetical protein
VCGENFGLEVGANQLQAYSELRAYLGDNDGHDLSAVGPGRDIPVYHDLSQMLPSHMLRCYYIIVVYIYTRVTASTVK